MIAASASNLQAQLGKIAYSRPFRRCQRLALDAFEQARAAGRGRVHLVLPPGTGKTVLGLEVARRMGNPTVVLCPNTAIQSQWTRQWCDFQPPLVEPSQDADTLSPLTALTYQALCTLENDSPELDERATALWRAEIQAAEGLSPEDALAEIQRLESAGAPLYRTELARFRQRARTLTVRGGDREELLALLHPHGLRLIEEMKRTGPWTLVLDECHHLLDMWGYLVHAVVEELGDETFVLGLTATPPLDLDARQLELYRDLFERTDFELPTPVAVKDGSLAPYQDLVYLSRPMDHEIRYIADQHARFLCLISRLMDADFGSLHFVEWVHRRAVERRTRDGLQIAWQRFEQDRPALAQAALRFLQHHHLEFPEGVRLQERHRRAPDADDWVELIEDYCTHYLKGSADPRDAAAWQEVRAALPSIGYVLTRQGIRSYVSPVDRVLALSASKGAASLAILGVEQAALGERLRAVLLCDYEQAGSDLLARLRGVLDPQAGSAALLMHVLLSDPGVARLNPILLTGKTVACSRATAADLAVWIEGQVPELRGLMATEPVGATHASPLHPDGSVEQFGISRQDVAGPTWDDLVSLRPDSSWWRPRHYVPLVTRYFEEGRSRCLVGTRGLLGEGWDARGVNVLVDLTAATTSTAVHQSRGRSLRLDPAVPKKVADNWDVVCVAPDHPKGMSDYLRFVRKHQHYYALTADGEVESGVSHVHPSLSPYGPPPSEEFERINQRMLERVREREEVYARWRVGQPYENREVQTLRVRLARPDGLPDQRRLREAEASDRVAGEAPVRGKLTLFGLSTALALLLVATQFELAALLVVASGAAWLRRALASPVRPLDDSGGVEQLAAAVAEGLRAAGAIPRRLGQRDVRVVAQSDGYYRCYLAGVSAEESRLFADAMDELIAPLGSPRYIIPRRVLRGSGRLRRATSRLAYQVSPRLGDVGLVYHAVPSYFGANRKRLEAFQRAWNRHVSPGRSLFCQNPRAKAILEVMRGENPFDASTQIRTLWR